MARPLKKPSPKPIVERFERAVRAHAFKGTQCPEKHPAIEREYEDAKRILLELLGVYND